MKRLRRKVKAIGNFHTLVHREKSTSKPTTLLSRDELQTPRTSKYTAANAISISTSRLERIFVLLVERSRSLIENTPGGPPLQSVRRINSLFLSIFRCSIGLHSTPTAGILAKSSDRKSSSLFLSRFHFPFYLFFFFLFLFFFISHFWWLEAVDFVAYKGGIKSDTVLASCYLYLGRGSMLGRGRLRVWKKKKKE